MSAPVRILSLGAGVQSSTLALMIAAGDLPMVDGAIFADTQWEPAHVYRWLDWLEKQLPFPVYRVTAGNIRANVTAKQNTTGQRFASLPFHLVMPDGEKSMARRQCTREYKITPIRQQSRKLMLAAGAKAVEQWIGISTDEAQRMKPSGRQYINNRWPLIEAGMSRRDCLAWMQARGYPQPPKSACIGCPFTDNARWRDMRDNDPESWADVVEVDRIIRKPVRGRRVAQFIHRDCVPLDQVDLRTAADHGQADLWGNECEGMCGV